MRMSGISLESIPPLNIPLRFFLTAPWFGVLAALLMLSSGPELWASRWNPVLIGMTHLVTLGFMTMTMLGALFQLLPVLGGVAVPAARPVALLVHLSLVAGVLLLGAGLVFGEFRMLWLAVPLLVLAISSFIVAVAARLVTGSAGGDSIHAIRLAVAALLITLGLGLYRVIAYAYPLPAVHDLALLHVGWALLGWVLILVMGVSFQVIPMFQVTPDYPPWLTRIVPLLLFAGLLLIGFVAMPAAGMLIMTMDAAVLAWAAYSLNLMRYRKRRLPDMSVRFWQLGLSSLSLAAVMFALLFMLPGAAGPLLNSGTGLMLCGVLMILGFACSVIMGMLQKIVPFLAYLHMQRQCAYDSRAISSLPHMHAIIRPQDSMWQFRLHVLAVAGVLGAVVYGPLTALAGILLLLDFGWLGWLLTRAALLYRTTTRGIISLQATRDG